MPRSGDTTFEPNQKWFDTILRTSRVEALTDAAGQRALTNMQANAPVDSGDYRSRLRLEHRQSRYRRVTRVVGRDRKTLIIESQRGVMARGLKAAKG